MGQGLGGRIRGGVGSGPEVLEDGRGDVVAVVAGDGGPEVLAVGVVDALEAGLVDVGAGLVVGGGDVLGEEVEGGGGGGGGREGGGGVVVGFGEDGDGVLWGLR